MVDNFRQILPFEIFRDETSEIPVSTPSLSLFSYLLPQKDSWKGDIVVAKFRDQPFGTIMDCAVSDYPLISMSFFVLSHDDTDAILLTTENWFLLHGPNDHV
jgi:hypothetical protein